MCSLPGIKLVFNERCSYLAMNSYGTRCVLAGGQKLLHDLQIRTRAILEEQILMLEAGVGELAFVVPFLVQSDDGGDVLFSKVVKIEAGLKLGAVVHEAGSIVRTGEGEHFVWNDPVQIAVLHLFKVNILLHIELVQIEKFELTRPFDRLEAVEQAERVGTRRYAGVTIADERYFVIVGQQTVDGVRLVVQVKNRIAPADKRGIHKFLFFPAGHVYEDLVLFFGQLMGLMENGSIRHLWVNHKN